MFDPTTIVPQAGARTVGEPLMCTASDNTRYTALLRRRGMVSVCARVCVCVCVGGGILHCVSNFVVTFTSVQH